MIRPAQLRDRVIVPVLSLLDSTMVPPPGSQGAAVELLLGTAMQESHCGDYIAQTHGPARGVWQMEPATEGDIWTNFLAFKPHLADAINSLLAPGIPRTDQLAGNLYYACAMARMQFLRSRDPMPAEGDIQGQSAFYVKVYNAGGKATEAEYMANWRQLQAAM